MVRTLLHELPVCRAGGEGVRHLPLYLLERDRLPRYPLYYRPDYEYEREEGYEHDRRVLYDYRYELRRDVGALLLGGLAQPRLDLRDSLVKWSAHPAYNVAPPL